jgi:hypothetical protein
MTWTINESDLWRRNAQWNVQTAPSPVFVPQIQAHATELWVFGTDGTPRIFGYDEVGMALAYFQALLMEKGFME